MLLSIWCVWYCNSLMSETGVVEIAGDCYGTFSIVFGNTSNCAGLCHFAV